MSAGAGVPTARIRIVYLIWNLKPAGAERQLLVLLRRLDPSRFEPYLVVFKKGACDVDCPCRVVVVDPNVRRWGAALGGLIAFFKLLGVLRRLRPQILHSFLPEIALVYGAAAAKLLRIPVFVCGRRASAKLHRRGPMMRLAETLALRRTQAMAVNAEFLREELVEAGYGPERIAVISNGIESQRFRPGKLARKIELGWPDSAIVVGMVANFRPCKRHDLLVQAAAILQAANPEVRLLLVGNDVGTLTAVERQVAELGLTDITRIVTGCSRVEAFLGTMDLVACASDTEGLSNALLEAMACGLPVVATDVPGNTELIIHGVDGLLVPAGDAHALAAALARLVEEPALRQRMGEAGRSRAVRQFSMGAMVSGYERLYAGMVAEHAAGILKQALREPGRQGSRISG